MNTTREQMLTAIAEDLLARAAKETDADAKAKLERAAKWYVDALLRGWR